MTCRKCNEKCTEKVAKEEGRNKRNKVLIKYKNATHCIVPSDCLLDDLKKLGIPVGSGCRVGICGICKIQVKAGEIEYVSPPLAYLKEGEAITCIGKIRSDLDIKDM